MTTYTAFQPPPNNSFSFQPTLDGNTCTAVVWWNTDAQRWFITLTQPNGTPIFTVPLLGSPTPVSLQSLSWANGIVTGTTDEPHNYHLTDTVMLTVSGCTPDVYNGTLPCFIVGATTFQYSLPDNPGVSDTDQATQLGTLSYDINLGAGYLDTSTIVYRESTQMFEVTP